MADLKRCPYCEAVLDTIALKTNICSACESILGGFNKSATTLELNRGQNAITVELYDKKAGMETVSLDPGDFDCSFWEEPISDPEAQEYPKLVVNQRYFDSEGVKSPDYEIFCKLGSGGMGEIHDASQKCLGREVAIKILKSSTLGTENSIEKFQAEAAITGNLEHPNIVPIYDLGYNKDKVPFYTMKKVKGTPWSDAMPGKSLQENIEILLRVCDAVAFAHSKGIIHRDLKPENVMLGEFNEVLVMDWGLAAGVFAASKAPKVTYADAIAGTPAYMAPEMARGQEKKIGFSSDIYLLGAILYEIITGEPPHGGRTIRECLSNAAQNEIAKPWVSSELLKTACKAMATEQSRRYLSVREFQSSIKEHYRSVELVTRARKFQIKARKNREYHDYFRALFGFKEALEVWEGNDEARKYLNESVREFIELALENGEKTLARSLLVESDEDLSELAQKIDG